MSQFLLPLEATLTLLSVYYGVLAIYRLYFHPLAKFPGPKMNAISPLPVIYQLLRGRNSMTNKRLHEQYGSIVRVSPNELAFNSPQAWKDMYTHRPGTPSMLLDPIQVGAVNSIAGVTTLTMCDDETHARQRRGLSHAFSVKALQEQEPLIRESVDRLVACFKRFSETGNTFNLVEWLNFTTFDVFGDLLFGEPFGCLEKGIAHFWVSTINDTVRVGAIEQATRRLATPGSPLQKLLLKLVPDSVRQKRVDHMNFTRRKVMERLDRPTTSNTDARKDFIWYIYESRGNKDAKGQDIHRDEIIVNAALLIIGGSETTATLLSGLFGRLCWDMARFNKLEDEIRRSFSSDAELTFENVSKLEYLNACLEEALRVFPPVPTGYMRSAPKGGIVIDGRFVPEGTTVEMSAWSASHNPAHFHDPDSFIPERWIETSPTSPFSSDIKNAIQPFALGHRNCIGKNLAYMEMRLIVAKLLFHFDIRTTDHAALWTPEGDYKHCEAYTTWMKPPLNVTCKLRDVLIVKR